MPMTTYLRPSIHQNGPQILGAKGTSWTRSIRATQISTNPVKKIEPKEYITHNILFMEFCVPYTYGFEKALTYIENVF
jgi:hypothetical protein